MGYPINGGVDIIGHSGVLFVCWQDRIVVDIGTVKISIFSVTFL